MVPDKAAAMPNLPLFRMFIATLNPPPTPENKQHHQCKGHNSNISNSHTICHTCVWLLKCTKIYIFI